MTDFIASFAVACPDWALTFIAMKRRPLVFGRARRVVVIDAALPTVEKARQVGLAVDAILDPDGDHPEVDVIDQA